MNFKTKHTILAMSVMATLFGCGVESEDTRVSGKVNSIEQLSIEQPVIEINVVESDSVMEVDLLQGINNPSGTEVFVYNFTLPRLFDDGTPDFEQTDMSIEQPSVPNLREIGAPGDSNYMLFDTLQGGVEVAGSTLVIKPFIWTEELAYQETAVYKLYYEMDNGYDNGDDDFDNDLLNRTIHLTVTGAEDPVESINIIEGSSFEVAQGFSVTINAEVLPESASLPELVWSSSDDSIVRVTGLKDGNSHTPNIEAIAYADGETGDKEVTITANLLEGASMGTVFGSITAIVTEFPNGPVGVEVKVDGEAVSNVNVIDGEPLQLTADVLPLDAPFSDRSVTWESSNPNAMRVSDTGVVIVVNPNAEPTTLRVIANDNGRATTVTLTPQSSPNALFRANGGFESGTLGDWVHYWTTDAGFTLDVTEDAAKDGMYGVEFTSAGTSHSGVNLPSSRIKPSMPSDFADGTKSRKFIFSYDIKMNNYGVDRTVSPSFLRFIPVGGWPLRLEEWHSSITSSDWTHVEVEFDEPDWSSLVGDFHLDLYFIGGRGPIDAYIDNFSIVCSENCE